MTHKNRTALDGEIKHVSDLMAKEESEHFANTMILKKGKIFGDYNDARHARDLKLVTNFKTQKEEELQKIKDQRDQAQQTFMSMTEL